MISWILIIGVASSVVLASAGLLVNYLQTGSAYPDLSANSPWHVVAKNFFSFVWYTAPNAFSSPSALNLVALGVILLMFTPYARVVVSVLYFGKTRDAKYLGITLLVLLIITSGLLFL
jgi:uncharacterized membrane protein